MYKYFIISSLLILVLSTTSFSQDNLSLSDAIRIGLDRNYDIAIERKNVESAELLNQWGEAGRYPTLSLNINQNNSITNIDNPASFLAGDVVNNSINPTVNLDWTLFNGFRANISKQRLAALQEESEGNASVVISNTIQSIILGYYQAVLEKRRMEEFEKQFNLSADKYSYTKVKFDLGSGTTSDLLLDEGNYLTDSANLINQQIAYGNAIRNLNLLLANPDPNEDYNFTDDLEQYELTDYGIEDLQTRLDAKNVDLRKQYLTQSILKHDVRLQRSGRSPTLSLIGVYSYDRNRQDLSGASFAGGEVPPDAVTAVTTNYSANFVLSFTLFDGGRINRAIKNAVVQQDIGNLRLEQLKNSLQEDLAEAYDQYNIRKELYRINTRKQAVAQTNLEISEEKYKTGTINSFDYRTVQNTNLSAAIEELQSLYDLIDSHVTLMRLTGGIIETYR